MLVVVDEVGDNHRRAFMPREVAQSLEIWRKTHIRVTGIPGGDVISLDGIHIDINSEEIVATLGAILDGVGDEEGCMNSLSLKSALHICRTDNYGVDLSACYICL